MTPWIYLDPTDQVPGRPFTDPDRSAGDLMVMTDMVARLSWILRMGGEVVLQLCPLVLNFKEAGGSEHRVVIAHPDKLLLELDLTVVGFFGQRRPGADPGLITAFDRELIDEFNQNPDMLSYSSRQLPNGNWGNLVLFSRPEAKQDWGTSAKHAYVARELAPVYYISIRLHNGWLAGGLQQSHNLALERTKYYDFETNGWWQAVREWQPPTAGE